MDRQSRIATFRIPAAVGPKFVARKIEPAATLGVNRVADLAWAAGRARPTRMGTCRLPPLSVFPTPLPRAFARLTVMSQLAWIARQLDTGRTRTSGAGFSDWRNRTGRTFRTPRRFY
jgi:hypothetical protein